MLERLRVWPLLSGYRGRPGVDVDGLLELLMRFSYLVADYPEIAEIEINPLLAGVDRAIALDARIVLDRDALVHPVPPFGHLAIRPYPEELTTQVELSDGTPVTLRPIKPEDEPEWHEMLAASSEESIRMRFRGVVRHASHRFATRYCFIDYDREMAIVAEVRDGSRSSLAGVGRLVTEPDRRIAEYALLVADPWQNRGLSQPLTERCLEIARNWGVGTVWAETDPENRRMISVLRRHGFSVAAKTGEGILSASLDLRS
jgi:acetyltransferase